MNWLLDIFKSNKQEKKAVLVNKQIEFDKKVLVNNWIVDLMNTDEQALVKDADQKQQEFEDVKGFKKDAAYNMGETCDDTIKKDYELRVKGLSNYNLAEMLTDYSDEPVEKSSEVKEKMKKYVEGSRGTAEKKLLDYIGKHTLLNWKESFEKFKKSEVKQPKEEDLYGPKFEGGKQNWEKSVDYGVPTDKERMEGMEGVGKEEQKGQVGKKASQQKKSFLNKKAFHIGDKLYYRGHPSKIVDIYVNPFSYETNVDVECEGKKVTLDKKELRQLSDDPMYEIEKSKEQSKIEEPKPEEELEMESKKMSDEANTFISKHIEKHIKEDKMARDQAVAVAYQEAKEKGYDVPEKETNEEIQSKVSKTDVIKKIAEIESPWTVEKAADGTDVIVRKNIKSKNTEDLKKEITSKDLK